MRAIELCSRDVVSAHADESVIEAARRMADAGVGALVVVDGDTSRRPIGIVTDRDLVIRALVRGEPLASRVADVMNPTIVVARVDEQVDDVLARLQQQAVRRIPIVDASGGLVGILTLDDIVTWLAERMADVAGLLARQASEE